MIARLRKRTLVFLALFASMICFASAQTLDVDNASHLYGYRNSDGKWKIAPIYQQASPFTSAARGFAVVKRDNRWGCIDRDGSVVVRVVFNSREEAERAGSEWQRAEEPGKWVYPVQNGADGRWGFVNYYGQWKFQPIYEDADCFHGSDPMSFAPVKIEGRWGCIDAKGILIINNIFHTKDQAIDAGNQWIVGLHYDTWKYPVSHPKTGQWGYVNYLGRWVIDPAYEACGFFGDDNNYPYAQVKSEGRWGNIERSGKTVSECVFFSQNDALYALRQKEHGRPLDGWRLPVSHPTTLLWGWVDYEGNWVTPPQYEAVTNYANDTGMFATAKLDGHWCSIHADGTPLSKAVFTLSSEAWLAGNEWDTHQELGHWLYPIREAASGNWGFVNYRGEWVIKPMFEDAKCFIYTWNNRVAPVKQEGRWGCIDHTGRFVVTNQYNSSAEAYVAGRHWGEKQKF